MPSPKKVRGLLKKILKYARDEAYPRVPNWRKADYMHISWSMGMEEPDRKLLHDTPEEELQALWAKLVDA